MLQFGQQGTFLPKAVIWKWESDANLPGQLDNVIFWKCIPQQDVLGSFNNTVFLLLIIS